MYLGLIMLVFLFLGYLSGSLSSAVIVCKAMKLPDPRTSGSNNPGATNVMRVGGKKASYLTFFGDFLKGFLPVLIVSLIFNNQFYTSAIALGAFLGHLYPVFFGFKGGKGVATFVGILVAINPLLFLVFGVCWVSLLFISNYVSVGSMLAGVFVAIGSYFLYGFGPLFILFILLSALIIYRHKSNIIKLKNGEELGFKKKDSNVK